LLGLISGYLESEDDQAGLEDVIVEGAGAGIFMGLLAAVAVMLGGSGIIEYTTIHGILFFDWISSNVVTLTGAGAMKTGLFVFALTLLDAIIPGYIGGTVVHELQDELTE
jgi:hypothetical protein